MLLILLQRIKDDKRLNPANRKCDVRFFEIEQGIKNYEKNI